MDEEKKIEKIAFHFSKIMEALGLDLRDKNLAKTPQRVAKMYVQELFIGLNKQKAPEVTLFENLPADGYSDMVVEKDISFFSHCEHHFVPFFGRAHVAYIPKQKIIGLSKINRLVDYCARKPQVQERLTTQIRLALQTRLDTTDVAVVLDGMHFCIAARGVSDIGSRTVTRSFGGVFTQKGKQDDLYHHLAFPQKH